MRQKRSKFAAVSLALLLGATSCWAVPGWQFATIPADGAIEGAPGTTIGWGYTIENQDPLRWLSMTSLSADVFSQATPNVLFDFPVLAPLSTVTVNYAPGTGLFEITWDSGAVAGHVESGVFLASAEWYDADPLAGGTMGDIAEDVGAAYSARVSGGAVPLPSTLSLLVAAIAGIGFARRRAARLAPLD